MSLLLFRNSPPPAKASTLVDTFDDGVINTTLWNVAQIVNGDVAESGGRLVMRVVQFDSVDSSLESKSNYDISDSSIVVEAAWPSVSAGSQSYKIEFSQDSNGFAASSNGVTTTFSIGSTTNNQPYSNTAHKWIRFSQASGVKKVEYSADGLSWTTAVQVNDASVSFGKFRASTLVQDSTSAASFSIDNLNNAPAAPSVTNKSASDTSSLSVSDVHSTPKTQTLVSAFDNSNGFRFNSAAVVSGGRLTITPSSSYPGGQSTDLYDARNSYSFVELVQVPTGTTTQAILQWLTVSGGKTAIGYRNGNLYFEDDANGAYSITTVPYNSGNHRFIRLRHDGTNIHWETSSDSQSWTIQRTLAAGTDYSRTQINLLSGFYGTETTVGTTVFDNFNVPVEIVITPKSASDSSAITVADRGVGPDSLLWEEQFLGTLGSVPNLDNWTIKTGPGANYGNSEEQYYTERQENIGLDGAGNLVLTARNESYLGYNYTSGRVDSRKKVTTMYGRIEARIKLPFAGQGLWPAFWIMADEDIYGQWPRNGEIDIMEAVNDMSFVSGAVHAATVANPAVKWTTDKRYSPGGSLGDDYHIYALEWEPDELHWLVDGVRYYTLRRSEVNESVNQWLFNDRQFYVILNLAVGGGMPGAATPGPHFPAEMKIDYVKFYTRPVGAYNDSNQKAATLSSSFSDQREFDNWNSNARVSNGRLVIETLNSYPGILSQRRFDLTNSSVMIELVQTPNAGNGTTQTAFQLIDGNNSANKLEFGWTNNTLYAGENNGGTTDSVYPGYNVVNDRYLRIRHDGTNVIWETSPNGTTWNTPIKTKSVTTTNLTNMQVSIISGYYGTETTPGSATWDNLNVVGVTSTAKSASDTASVSTSETATNNVQQPAADATGLSVSETTSRFVTVTATDTSSISATDNSSISVSAPGVETAALAAVESTIISVTLNTGDTGALQVTETASPASQQNTADSGSIAISETASSLVTVFSSDTGSLTASESQGILLTKGTQDTAGIATSESHTRYNTLVSTDASGMTANDNSVLDSNLPGYENISVGLSENSSLTVTQTVTDAGGIGLVEAVSTSVSVAVSDTSSLVASDVVSTQVSQNRSDSATLSVSESTTSNLFVSTSDVATLAIAENTNVATTQPGVDNGSIAVNETATTNITAQPTDSTGLALSESSAVVISFSAIDTSGMRITDNSSVYGPVSASDSIGIGVSENTSRFVTLTANDSGSVAVSEANARYATVTATDTSALIVSENSSADITMPGSESASIGSSEETQIAVSSSSADSGNLAVTENVTNFVFVTSNDVAAISLQEVSVQNVGLESLDSGQLQILDISLSAIDVSSVDNSSVGVEENVNLDSALPGTDLVSTSLVESTHIATSSQATDNLSVGIIESTSVFVEVAVTEQSALGVIENAGLDSEIPGQESTSVGLSETSCVEVAFSTNDAATLAISEYADSDAVNFFYEDISLSVVESASTVATGQTEDTHSIATEESSSVFITVATSDTITLSGAESTQRANALNSEDASSISLVESVGLAAAQPGTETIALGVSESTEIQVRLSSNDALSLNVAESASNTVYTFADDVVSLGSNETVKTNVSPVTTDDVNVSVNESGGVFMVVTASDSISLNTVDSTANSATVGAVDSTTVRLFENKIHNVFLSSADYSSLRVAEASNASVVIATSENVELRLSESSGVSNTGQALPGAEPIVIAISETTHLVVSSRGTDTSAISVSEARDNRVSFNATDNLNVRALENIDIFVEVLASEQLNVDTHENVHIGFFEAYLFVTSEDELFITALESAKHIKPQDAGWYLGGGTSTASSLSSEHRTEKHTRTTRKTVVSLDTETEQTGFASGK